MIKQAVPLLGNFMRARLEKILYTDFPRHVKFDEKAMAALVRKTREFLVPLTHTDPVNLLGSEPVTLTLQEMASRVFDQYVPLINEARLLHPWLRKQLDQTALRREYDDFIARVVLPKTFETSSGVITDSADLTSEVTVTQEKEQEVEVEVTPAAPPLYLTYDLHPPIDWDGNLLEWTKKRAPAFCLGKTQVYFGPNTTQFAAKKNRFLSDAVNPLNEKYQKPVYHAMYFQREGETHDILFLGDIEDMKRVKQYIDAHATERPVLQSSHGEPPQPGASTQPDTSTNQSDTSAQPGTDTQANAAMQPVKTEHIWQLDGITDGCYIHEGNRIVMTFGNGRFAAAEDDNKRRIMLILKLGSHALADRLPCKADKEAIRFWMKQSPRDAEKIMAYFNRIRKSDDRMSKAIDYICKDEK